MSTPLPLYRARTSLNENRVEDTLDNLYVTKTYMPEQHKIQKYLNSAFSSRQLTNRGPLERLLTERLQRYLNVENLLLVSNGTIALQIAQKALTPIIKNANAITSPFSFVATASSLVWEGIEPRFGDIDSLGLCLDPGSIRENIDSNTQTINPVHVFGNSCNIDAIDEIANAHNLKTIYDGAHAFGVRHKGRSLLDYGDAATLSFHATKLFHTAEGGAIVFKNAEDYEVAQEMTTFGYGQESGEIHGVGINAKLSEVHAAIGLAVLEDIDIIFDKRAAVWTRYYNSLAQHFTIPARTQGTSQNYSYFPIILETSELRKKMSALCKANGIFPRRYFYPSLNALEYMPRKYSCPVSESISDRILCLPLHPDLSISEQQRIINTITGVLA